MLREMFKHLRGNPAELSSGHCTFEMWTLGASRRTGFLGHWRTLMPKVLSHGHQNSKASIKLDGASFAESLKRG